MRRNIILLSVAVLLAMSPMAAYAKMIEGTVQGYQCVTEGKTCPVGYEDPVAAVEKVFVVLTQGKEYYFIPNIDRSILVRHLNERVRVRGKLNSKYNSIEATSFEVYENGKWRKTWDASMEKNVWRKVLGHSN